MRFALGLVIGLLVGAAATWAVLEKPWRGDVAPAVVIDAGPASEPTPRKKGGRKRTRSGGRGETGPSDGTADVPAPVLSAADRAMVWRGPAIALPPRSVDLASGDEARPLSPGEIDEVVAARSDAILACIESARAGADVPGEVKLEMLVGGDGVGTKVRIGAARWLIQHGLAECAAAAARRMRFPATGAPTIVSVPYHLD